MSVDRERLTPERGGGLLKQIVEVHCEDAAFGLDKRQMDGSGLIVGIQERQYAESVIEDFGDPEQQRLEPDEATVRKRPGRAIDLSKAANFRGVTREATISSKRE